MKYDDRYVRIPIEKVMIPKDGFRVITKSWWVIIDGCVLGYKLGNSRLLAPQCNRNKEITDKLKKGGTETFYIETAYWPT